jgi:hypothetical protein
MSFTKLCSTTVGISSLVDFFPQNIFEFVTPTKVVDSWVGLIYQKRLIELIIKDNLMLIVVAFLKECKV